MYGDGEGFRGERSLVGSRWSSAIAGRQSLLCFVFWWSDGRPFDKLRAGSGPSPILESGYALSRGCFHHGASAARSAWLPTPTERRPARTCRDQSVFGEPVRPRRTPAG